MKPTFQNKRPVVRGESTRPAGHSSNHSPFVEWNFQTSAADLRGGTCPSLVTEEVSAKQSLYRLSQTVFAAKAKSEDRLEAIGLSVVIAISAWPIAEAIYIAIRTV